jgi:opacity protein-like surface antigen
MRKIAMKALFAAMLAGTAMPALAADPYYPPDPQPMPVPVADNYGGWYIRGDVDYHWSKWRNAEYFIYDDPFGQTKTFDKGSLSGAPSLGLGVGYQIDDHFRVDLTGDYWFNSKFKGSTSGWVDDVFYTSTDKSKMSAYLLLANAYVDLGTWHRITPYVGAGIGGAWIKWDDLHNTLDDGSYFRHKGKGSWRFAYAAMAGASYCLTRNLKFDAGYRFSHIEGGKMFEFGGGAGPGYDKGFNTHEVRGGLRYQFGGDPRCSQPVPVAYEPTPEPVYTK